MPTDSAPSRPLLQHLDSLYALARTLTANEEQAIELVKATYRRAASIPPSDDETLRIQLFRLLMEHHTAASSSPPSASTEPQAVSTGDDEPSPFADFRRHVAQQTLERRLPVAFAVLSAQERLLLTLHDLEDLSLNTTARLLDRDPTALEDDLTAARARLWDLLQTQTSEIEYRLMQEFLSRDDLRTALQYAVKNQLDPPTTLRPAVAAIVEQSHEAAPFSDDASAQRFPDRPDASSPRRSAPTSARNIGSRLRHVGLAILIIAVAGLAGYLLSDTLTSSPQSPSPASLLTLSAQQAPSIQPMLETQQPTDVARFVRERLGWQLTVPTIEGAPLRGVSLVELIPGVQLPAFLYTDSTSGQPIITYALNYAVLDQHADRLHLAKEVRSALEEERNVDLHHQGNAGVLVWRERDDIYVTVTEGDPAPVKARIARSS